MSLNFCENGNFNNFVKNNFTNDPREQHKRRGIVIFRKICEICENKVTQNFPGIR